MSRADDLLKDLTEQEIIVRTEDEAIEPNIVIDEERFIHVPEELQKIAVQYDHRIETVTFDCPRYWDGADMSKMSIYIHYTREDGLVGMYLAKNVVVDEMENPNLMHFDWTLTRNATGMSGKLTFLVSINRVDKEGNVTQYWSSELCDDMTISVGMDNMEAIQDKYPDIIAQMYQVFTEDRETILKRADEMFVAIDENKTLIAEHKIFVEGRNAEISAEMTETQEMVQELNKIATPEAMKQYTKDYFDDKPDAILDAVGDFYSTATEADIDTILDGTFVDEGDSFEEEFSLATNSDIDEILAGTYIDIEEGGDTSNENDGFDEPVTDEELDNIIDNAF